MLYDRSSVITLIAELECETDASIFYQKLDKAGLIIVDYVDLMTTAPIVLDRELARLPQADFALCCALLTALLREDHFSDGSFQRRVRAGSIKAILKRIKQIL